MSELENLLKNVVAADSGDDIKHRSAEEVFQELIAGVETAEAQFVADFLDKMFAAAYFSRSNSKK
jgi:hypothetical protein